MSIGLKRGTVHLEAHDPAWDESARAVIAIMKSDLGGCAADIQHVGSTAIPAIPAKPIVDIAVAAVSLDAVAQRDVALLARGILFRRVQPKNASEDERFYVIGDTDARTHHIHIVPAGGEAWKNYIAFRDYLNARPDAAREYCALKEALAERFYDNRELYTQGKAALIERLLARARAWARNESSIEP